VLPDEANSSSVAQRGIDKPTTNRGIALISNGAIHRLAQHSGRQIGEPERSRRAIAPVHLAPVAAARRRSASATIGVNCASPSNCANFADREASSIKGAAFLRCAQRPSTHWPPPSERRRGNDPAVGELWAKLFCQSADRAAKSPNVDLPVAVEIACAAPGWSCFAMRRESGPVADVHCAVRLASPASTLKRKLKFAAGGMGAED